MINKIKDYLNKRRAEKATKRYYQLIAEGGAFLQFIHADLNYLKEKHSNRDQRKRFMKELEKEGKFSEELINYYCGKIDAIIKHIDSRKKKGK